MQDFSMVEIESMVIHIVGNKVKNEELRLSSEVCDKIDEVTNQYLNQFFFSSFKFDIAYKFTHETDIMLNEIYNYSSQVFSVKSDLLEQSINIAKHLYKVSTHPNIKAGELYVVYFKNCIIDDEVTEAIGIYKSENKDVYLEVKDYDTKFEIMHKKGISTKKLDKGCLIFNSGKQNNPLVFIVDTNNNDAMYWKREFLNLDNISNEFANTSTVLKTCNQFIKKSNEIQSDDKIKIINNSIHYFETHDDFELSKFVDKVFDKQEDSDKFKIYLEAIADNKIDEKFSISSKAVLKAKKLIKNNILLDSNIEIKISSNIQEFEDVLEKGFDEKKNMKYYKIYYKEEK